MSEPSELSLDLLTNSPRPLINVDQPNAVATGLWPTAIRVLASEKAHRTAATSATDLVHEIR
jgi:hypothetical protein